MISVQFVLTVSTFLWHEVSVTTIIPHCIWMFSIGSFIVTWCQTVIGVFSNNRNISTGLVDTYLSRQPLACLKRGMTIALPPSSISWFFKRQCTYIIFNHQYQTAKFTKMNKVKGFPDHFQLCPLSLPRILLFFRKLLLCICNKSNGGMIIIFLLFCLFVPYNKTITVI